MIVILRDREQVRVHQQAHWTCVEAGEHPADSWDADLTLVEDVPPFGQEDATGDDSVGVAIWMVVQAYHITAGDQMEEDRGEEGEEAHHATEGHLKCQDLDPQSGLQEDLWHKGKAGSTGGVREHLHP